MIFFILTVLAVLIGAFLVMTAVQLIKIEKVIAEYTDIADAKVKRIYGKG